MKTASMRASTLRVFLTAVSLAVGLVLLAALATAYAGNTAAPDSPPDPNRVDVVVDLGNGNVLTRRVTFTEPTLNGLQVLQRSGLNLEVVTYSFGAAVCSIEGVGCPATNCFCNPDKFWGYLYWEDGWQGYPTGPSGSTVANGGIEGWAWGAFGDTPPPITPEILSAGAALQWMRPQQQLNGSYGNVGATLDVILAVAAANRNPAQWQSSTGNSLLDFVSPRAAAFARQSAASTGKLALAVAAADLDPQQFAGLNLVISTTHYYNPATGAYGATVQDQALSMLGLDAAGAPIPAAAVQHLTGMVNANGGWGWTPGQPSDADSTSVALEALVAAGQPTNSPAVVNGQAYLHTVQQLNDDGGFAHSPDLPWAHDSNTNSTSYAIQSILATGQDPLSAAWSISATTPITFLLGQQLTNGAFVYVNPPADLFATQQAVPALVGKPFPLASRAVSLRKALGWIAGQQQPDGSFAGFNPGSTVDAVLAIVAAGGNPNSFISSTGKTPLDYLGTVAASYASQGVSAAGKLATGVARAGANPRNFGSVNLIAQIQDTYSAATGKYGAGATWDQAWALLGLASARGTIPPEAVTYLTGIHATGGGWGFTASAATADPDSTGLALQALAAAGVSRANPAVDGALAYLHQAQNPDGGFPGYGGTTDAGSTGLALQGLAAFRENPRSLGWTRTITDGSASRLTLHTPIDALLALQSPQGGFAGYSGPNDPFATYQAVPGAAFQPYVSRSPRLLYLPAARNNR